MYAAGMLRVAEELPLSFVSIPSARLITKGDTSGMFAFPGPLLQPFADMGRQGAREVLGK